MQSMTVHSIILLMAGGVVASAFTSTGNSITSRSSWSTRTVCAAIQQSAAARRQQLAPLVVGHRHYCHGGSRISRYGPIHSVRPTPVAAFGNTVLYSIGSFIGDNLVDAECIITPDGYGFAAPVRRILSEANRKPGFYQAKATETVVDVMDAITNGVHDVALVYDGDDDDDDDTKLLGLFTETDYIRFSRDRSSDTTNKDEAAAYLRRPVQDYVTPAKNLIALDPNDTANVAIAAMKIAGVRHVLLATAVSDDKKLTAASIMEGVISMQDVMALIQKDERLSLTSLSAKYPYIKDPVEQMQLEQQSNANKLASSPGRGKEDILRFGAATLFLVTLGAFLSQSPWLHDHAKLALIAVFVLGYLGIIFEEVFEFNKAGVALLMSTALWITYGDYLQSDGKASNAVLGQLSDQLADVSDICFFLLAASAIVEVVDAHQGFKVVTNLIKTTSKKQLFWVIGVITYFLSAILNNLTVTIVMVSLLRKLTPNEEDRKLFGAMVVIAANAGGVWTPIGDVTTTMLWINNQLSTIPTITDLFLPSLACLVGSLLFLVGQVEEDEATEGGVPEPTPLSTRGKIVFWTGIASLLCVPVFNELTGLPPYLAMLTGLGVMWTLTDVLHVGDEEQEGLKVPAALTRLDTAGILFFLGILMSIGVLDKSGLLKELAVFLSDTLPNLDIIATVIGIASALIDNVPLVAATMGMYDLSEYGTDDKLWQLIALCAGTGGSIFVIGSASGVALMGLEKVDFLWYARKVSIGAAVGYFAGIAAYLAQYAVFHGGIGTLLPQMAMVTDTAQQGLASVI